jgi:hypothetical protein
MWWPAEWPGGQIVSWKNRGDRLNRMFKRNPGKSPYALLSRSGIDDGRVPPFTISLPGDNQEERGQELESTIRAALAAEPDHYTKSALAQAIEGRKADALGAIARLQAKGVIVPNEKGAKLRLAEPSSNPGLWPVGE